MGEFTVSNLAYILKSVAPTHGLQNGTCYYFKCVAVVVVLGFTTLLTSQVISVAFYSEREKTKKNLLRGSNFGLRFFYVP